MSKKTLITFSKVLLVTTALSLPLSSSLLAMGGLKGTVDKIKPRSKKEQQAQKAHSAEPAVSTPQVVQKVVYVSPDGDVPIEKVDLSPEQLDEKRKFNKLLKRRQFEKAAVILNELPEGGLTKQERKIKKKLKVFDKVEAAAKENESMFKPDDSLEPSVKRTVKRLYRGAQSAYVNDQDKLAKDLLIQTLYLDRQHYRAKKLLEFGLDAPIGSYKVENVETKYWKASLSNFYSGYPAKAVEDLKVLEYFDPQNPEVFKRMGSFYYNMGEPKKAVDSWKRALYLDPGDKDLDKFISEAKKEIKRQEAFAKAQSKKKSARKKSEISEENLQLLRVVDDSNKAYSYAQEVRKKNPGREVVVDETEDGRWAVKIQKPKKGGKK